MTVLHYPLWVPLAATALGVFLVALAVGRLRLRRANRKTDGEPDWSTPVLDADAHRRSFFHQWDARIKIVSLFLYCFLVVSLQSLPWALTALVLSIIAVFMSRLPWHRPLRRLAAMAGFLSMFLVVVPFTAPSVPGETIIIFDPLTALPFHGNGFRLALLIIVKACAIALIMDPLLGTAPLAVTLQALTALRLPNSICQMILLAHRYIHVFNHEARRMYRGMRVRGFRPRTSISTLQAYGNFFGMLFVRSFDRTQRVYDAMLSRGYNGVFPSFVSFNASMQDWAKGLLWIIIGISLLAADRFFI